MSVPYEVRQSIAAVPAGESQQVVGVPFRGCINRLVVAQASGALEGFSYALFSGPEAFNVDGTLTAAAEAYRVTPQVDVPAGKSAAGGEGAFGLDYWYMNSQVDQADPTTRNTVRRGRLYLWLQTDGTGAKDFTFVLLVASGFTA